MPQNRRAGVAFIGLLLITLVAFWIALGSGAVTMDGTGLWELFTGGGSDMARMVVFDLRLPRAVSAFVVGAQLALAGALLQILLRNPLADPYVLGTSGGAAVFAFAALLLGATASGSTVAAFIGALTSVALVFGVAHGRGGWTPTRLLLTGVVMAAGWGAVISFMLSVSPDQNLRSMLFWLMGDLSEARHPGPGVVALIIGGGIALAIAGRLNLLQRGDLTAAALGVSVRPLRWSVYLLAALLTAFAVAQAGSIGFVGLVVPHLLRLCGLRDNRALLPNAILAGGTLLLLADTLARTLLQPQQLPVGVITALIGVPMFLLLLYRDQSLNSMGSRT